MISQTAVRYDPTASYPVRVFDVEYYRDAEDVRQIRIYQPQGPGPFPALVDVNGGQWGIRDRKQNYLIDTELAESGLVVAAIEFRPSTVAPYPAQIQDVNLGTRWFKAHAAEFNATADGLGGNGTSSGGHTLAMSAMRPHDPRYCIHPLPEAPDVDASLAYQMLLWPVLDPYARYLYALTVDLNDKALMATGGAMDRIPANSFQYFVTEEAMQEGNPTLALERGEPLALPPTLLVQGYPDGNIPRDMIWRFEDAYEARGGHVETQWFPGAPHGFARKPGVEHDRAVRRMKEFIARCLQQRGRD